MFMQMPRPVPHGSDSHSFTSEKGGEASEPRREPGPSAAARRPAHPRSSGAAGAPGSPGCNGRSSRRGPGCTPRGRRRSGSAGSRRSLRAGGGGALTFCRVPGRDLDTPRPIPNDWET